jgi:hypothetical protein
VVAHQQAIDDLDAKEKQTKNDREGENKRKTD